MGKLPRTLDQREGTARGPPILVRFRPKQKRPAKTAHLLVYLPTRTRDMREIRRRRRKELLRLVHCLAMISAPPSGYEGEICVLCCAPRASNEGLAPQVAAFRVADEMDKERAQDGSGDSYRFHLVGALSGNLVLQSEGPRARSLRKSRHLIATFSLGRHVRCSATTAIDAYGTGAGPSPEGDDGHSAHTPNHWLYASSSEVIRENSGEVYEFIVRP
uniref:Uncharacterized protein n=1 Tax=Mycena chlorophos TaxID=658473 RepID=A0ABQ0LWE9_MYCCL|nr:predicted protein [Mycena chlorophos]